jgi:hypothetical protein
VVVVACFLQRWIVSDSEEQQEPMFNRVSFDDRMV